MTLSLELLPHFRDHFVVLILDNEVTVENFVTTPPLPWIRMTCQGGAYRVQEGYPNTLTEEQAKREMRNWDQVSLAEISRSLKNLGEGVHDVVIGNNAGQGLPLAKDLLAEWRGEKAAVIYARNLPEIEAYRAQGYKTFLTRRNLASYAAELARAAGRPLALAFINTIQHNASNYHDP